MGIPLRGRMTDCVGASDCAAETACALDTTCKCAAGYGSAKGDGTDCTTCTAGTYADVPSIAACKTCPTGSNSVTPFKFCTCDDKT